MAKIKIQNVPEVATISQLLGVDANNKWAKIAGAKFATVEQVNAVDTKAIEAKQAATNAQKAAAAAALSANGAQQTAQAAQETAEAAAGTAGSVDAKATTALSNAAAAQSTATGAQNAADRLKSLMEGSVDYTVTGNVINIYAGQFLNGTLNPSAPDTDPIRKKVFRNFVHQYATADGVFTLNLSRLETFLGSGVYGWLNCLFLSARKVVCANVEITASSDSGIMAFRITVNDRAGTVECLSNCTAALTGNGLFLPPVPAGGTEAPVLHPYIGLNDLTWMADGQVFLTTSTETRLYITVDEHVLAIPKTGALAFDVICTKSASSRMIYVLDRSGDPIGRVSFSGLANYPTTLISCILISEGGLVTLTGSIQAIVAS